MLELGFYNKSIFLVVRWFCSKDLYLLAEFAINIFQVKPYECPLLGLLKALIKYKREKYVELYYLCVGLRSSLNKLPSNGNVNYLKAYLVTLGVHAECRCIERDSRVFDRRIGNEPWVAYYARIFARVNLHNVDPYLKSTFKLPEHPRWHTDKT